MITTSLKRSRSLLNKVLPIDIEGDKHSSPSVVTRSSPILNHDSESLHSNKSLVSKNSNKKTSKSPSRQGSNNKNTKKTNGHKKRRNSSYQKERTEKSELSQSKRGSDILDQRSKLDWILIVAIGSLILLIYILN
ncbi:hypothetical protein MGS_02870 [Candida albicans P78042]|nr:hypothetical protein MG9_02880 [Candida albicans P37037]KGT69848.1 hypothetical protein MEK_02889 [Candida albicans 12C]KGU30653.1 hypothetical protein MGK_02869 [Candida albicans P57055]KHC78591.1 hypothetical protein MGS_02870 [Candida albicans P78042]